MNRPLWEDMKCSKCGNLAHYQTLMYLENKAVPELEYLCKTCLTQTELPPKTTVTITRCAEPNCGKMANGRFELVSPFGDKEIIEEHYLCGEHGWRWRQNIGSESEMVVQSISPNGRETFPEPRRIFRDDLRGAFWGEESDKIN